MFFCKKLTRVDKMLNRFNEVLQTAVDVLAPPPTPIQNFEYHWKQVKTFYTIDKKNVPRIHFNDTNIPYHIEEMLQIIIHEESQNKNQNDIIDNTQTTTKTNDTECLSFMLNTRPLDLLAELATTDTPPGATVCILNWCRRFLTCLPYPRLDHEAIFQPIHKLILLCNGNRRSPYEEEEILFLLTVAGLIRKEPFLINLFLPTHQHSAYVNAKIKQNRNQMIPIKNPLFECTKVEANIRRVSILHDATATTSSAASSVILEATTKNPCDDNTTANNLICDNNKINDCAIANESTNSVQNDYSIITKSFVCDCDENDRFGLLETILTYFDSADSMVVVRACESALILASLPSVDMNCVAVKLSLSSFSFKNAKRLAQLCEQIPDDMNTGDIEDYIVSWGLVPRDANAPHFIGRGQLNEFLCWLDYSNCLSLECSEISHYICAHVRQELLENIVEPAMLDINAQFMLVLAAKIVKQLDSAKFSDELSIWLIGKSCDDDDNESIDIEENCCNECLLTILIENAQGNSDILLPTLQFIESLLDNANERILHGMLFRYINSRGYYDITAQQPIQSWSDEEDERARPPRTSTDEPFKSRTLAPTNILKVINSFLLLLPRQIMLDTGGTCYEEYVQDASRHYQNWITKTKNFNWPIEANFPNESTQSPNTSNSNIDRELPPPPPLKSTTTRNKTRKDLHDSATDSGIAEEIFYEGPLLRLLFVHVRNMANHPYELNLAVIAILSKLAFLPHLYLHEILLNPEIPIVRGTNTLWSSMQYLARYLLLEVPRREGFQKKVRETGKRLLTNPPLSSETEEESDPLFESLVVLEEFCKELAAIAFVKYHHATE